MIKGWKSSSSLRAPASYGAPGCSSRASCRRATRARCAASCTSPSTRSRADSDDAPPPPPSPAALPVHVVGPLVALGPRHVVLGRGGRAARERASVTPREHRDAARFSRAGVPAGDRRRARRAELIVGRAKAWEGPLTTRGRTVPQDSTVARVLAVLTSSGRAADVERARACSSILASITGWSSSQYSASEPGQRSAASETAHSPRTGMRTDADGRALH